MIIILSSLALAFLIGLSKPIRTKYKKLFAVLAISSAILAVAFPILTPVYMKLETASFLAHRNALPECDILIKDKALINELKSNHSFIDITSSDSIKYLSASSFSIGTEEILLHANQTKANEILITSINEPTSFIYFPYIPGLDEYIRIFPIHVPLAWVAVLAFVLSLINSVQFLRTKTQLYDLSAYSAALWGVMFCLGATITGMIWAKHSWGSYWNWDPRETSIFLLLLVYFAYFALRSAITSEQTKATLSAVYSIIAGISMPFFIFIIPRIASGLHPGSADNQDAPIISSGQSILDSSLLYSFGFSLFAFTLLFFYLYYLQIEKLNRKRHPNN